MSKQAEELAKKLFQERWGIALERIPESCEKTPDYAVYFHGQRIATLEVKALENGCLTLPSNSMRAMNLEEELEAGTSDDNTVSRVAGKIHQATKQLAAYAGPKGLVLVNYDLAPDFHDLREALQGYLPYSDGTLVSSLPQPDVKARTSFTHRNLGETLWSQYFKPREDANHSGSAATRVPA